MGGADLMTIINVSFHDSSKIDDKHYFVSDKHYSGYGTTGGGLNLPSSKEIVQLKPRRDGKFDAYIIIHL